MGMVIKGSYRYEQNFWEQENNGDLLSLKAFRNLYQQDVSPTKEESSKVMWAIYLIYDYASHLAKIPPTQRVQKVEEEFLEKPNYFTLYKAHLNPVISAYLDLQKGSERRYLETWEEMIEKRRVFLKDTPYQKDTWEMLDKMALASDKILAQKDEILKRIDTQEGGQIKGGQSLSFLAKKEIVVEETVDQEKKDNFINYKIDYDENPFKMKEYDSGIPLIDNKVHKESLPRDKPTPSKKGKNSK